MTLKFLLLNVCSIKSKINNVILTDYLSEFDVIGLTETLTNCFDDAIFPNHTVLTGAIDDKLKGHRGLAFLIRKTITAEPIEGNSNGIWLKIRANTTAWLILHAT
jgi:exonuclease III